MAPLCSLSSKGSTFNHLYWDWGRMNEWSECLPLWHVWLLVIAGLSLLFSVCTACIGQGSKAWGNCAKGCLGGFLCGTGLWLPASLLLCIFKTDRYECELCMGRASCARGVACRGDGHRASCLASNKEAYSCIPDSDLYSCIACKAPLKLWPTDELPIAKARCSKCSAQLSSNVHVCFTCPETISDRHHLCSEHRPFVHNPVYPSHTCALIPGMSACAICGEGRTPVDFKNLDKLGAAPRDPDQEPALDVHSVTVCDGSDNSPSAPMLPQAAAMLPGGWIVPSPPKNIPSAPLLPRHEEEMAPPSYEMAMS